MSSRTRQSVAICTGGGSPSGLASGHVDESRNSTAQTQQRAQLDCGFGRTKRGSIEQAQTQIDRGRIERVDRRVQIDPQRFRGVEFQRTHDQVHRQRMTGWPWAMVAPVAQVQRIGQRRARL